MTKPLVSIVMPSYNQSAFLEEALCSVLDQTYPRLEVLVVDGGSTDESVEIIRRYADRIDWWTSAPDGGQVEALNRGFGKAQGEILGWLNSDDYLLPGAIEAAVDALSGQPDALLAYGGVQIVDERGEVLEYVPPPIVDLREMVASCHYAVNQQGALFPRRTLEAVGPLNEESWYLFDAELAVKIALAGPLVRVDSPLGAYRFHVDSKTIASSRAKAADYVRFYDELLPSLALPPGVLEVVPEGRVRAYAWAAELFYGAGDSSTARRLAFRALRSRPSQAIPRLLPLLARFALPQPVVELARRFVRRSAEH